MAIFIIAAILSKSIFDPFFYADAAVKFIVDNYLLVSIATLSGGMLLWPLLNGRSGAAGLNPSQTTQLLNQQNAVLLDLRTNEEFAGGHVAQAKNLPLAALEAKPDSAGKKDKPVILMCQNGAVARKATAVLRQAGFAQVFNLHGGLAAWQAAGLPIVKTKP